MSKVKKEYITVGSILKALDEVDPNNQVIVLNTEVDKAMIIEGYTKGYKFIKDGSTVISSGKPEEGVEYEEMIVILV